ncbi:glutathione S-transferase C-terminal-like protein [Wolfiporia cocos MD-104 SS10]|uniref:glutathione transferase n=1 Tax=Wolfiporia cocos (strain MD-104) TaxID=742152 RepID=A0A2H3J1X7_WOLCO|nr:glutathione S-transferase C-terminal-like protein [Wolfiporia cocos MD-104 SS10]
MSHGKQFTLYTHGSGPNGLKVIIVLEELSLTYESNYLDFNKNEQKSPAHVALNPNGRIPTLIDHANNDFVVWESNAILLYLVGKYDTTRKLSAEKFEEKVLQLQWLFFQASGQGHVWQIPYIGQAVWFKRYHHEKIPSAIERYQKETLRVLGVLDSVLSKQKWLVGDKCTIADLSFVTWNNYVIHDICTDINDVDVEKDFPALYKWHNALVSRGSVHKALAEREAFLAAQSQ